jgi:hypothetical protein
LDDLAIRQNSIWKNERELEGIDLNISEQEFFLNGLIESAKKILFQKINLTITDIYFDNKHMRMLMVLFYLRCLIR